MQVWILPALMGLGLAAATGLRTFLPLLLLAAVARLGLFGVSINPHVAWLGSTGALVALGVATVVELVGDKVPMVDHALSALGTVTRPLAGVLAAGAVFSHADPAMAAVAGLIIGAPTALAFHAAQSGTRVVSTTTTAGLGNPIVSVFEDVASATLSFLAFLAPLLAAVVVAALLFVGFRSWAALRRRAS
ncbi:MAG TPA: DUF4126 domain-containing protein [Phenylobacterium sp.]|jgi:hypothetical protein